MKKQLTAIVLQGGGALGAFELGGLKRLYEDPDFAPDIVTGVSIGAINASVLIGGRGQPIENLHNLWEQLTIPGLPSASLFGHPNMYYFNPMLFFAPLSAISFYDTGPTYALLRRLVDLEKLNNSRTKVVLTAANIHTGGLESFDNHCETGIAYDHIAASGALPPGFPMIRIDHDAYWDGGLLSNTPCAVAFNELERLEPDNYEIPREVILFELFPRTSITPTSMDMVLDRIIELTFSNKQNAGNKYFEIISGFSQLIRELDKELPHHDKWDKFRKKQVFQKMLKHKEIRRTTITHLNYESVTGSNNFSRDAIERRIHNGYTATDRTLKESRQLP